MNTPRTATTPVFAVRTWILFPSRSLQFIRRWPVIPAIVLGLLIFSAAFADVVAPHDPYYQSLRERNTPPAWLSEGSSTYLLGTDALGRDILSRIIHGARVSLMVASIALVSGLVVGVSLGLLSGWFGGAIDETISRIVDIWYAMPFILVAFVIVILFGQSFGIMMLILALVSWVHFVRNVRADVLSLRDREYVLLAHICGASTVRIIWKHILPGVTSTIMVVATLSVGSLILTEATLSFLGVGIPAPTPAWGMMISEGRDYLGSAWWISFSPGVAIFLVVMSLNFLGDWLRDRFDPRLRQI